MTHIITAKKTTVTDAIEAYIQKRFDKFSKYAPDDIKVYTNIEVKDGGKRHKVEVTIPFGKQTLRAEVSDTDMYAAIDAVEKTMARLLKKRKEKMTQKHHAPGALVENNIETTVEQEYEIAKTKTHKIEKMTVQEACEAMVMIGHPFYVYLDSLTEHVCAVYARLDGTYGQIIYDN